MMHFFKNRSILTVVALAGGLTVSACGGSSTDNVDNSEVTELNAAGMMEGTTNDASTMEAATDTNIAAENVADNSMDEASNASSNTTGANAAE